MKILFDSHIFANQKLGGVSRYHVELYNGLIKRGHHPVIAGRFIKNQYLLSSSYKNQWFIPDPHAIFNLFNKRITKNNLLRQNSYNIFHPTYPREYLLKYLDPQKPMVFTIHDMIPEILFGEEIYSSAKYKFAKMATKIIAVSNHTKQDIIQIYNLPEDKIEVVHHGASFQKLLVPHPKLQLPGKYILFVGGRNTYKNFIFLVNALASILKSNKNLYLVCAGSRPFSLEEEQLLDSLQIKYQTLNYVNLADDKLAYVYSKAMVFVFPSSYEGFGIPILEAWACKTPVLLSKSSCFPELAGDAALYYNPGDAQSLSSEILKLITDDNEREALVMKGELKLTQYSWEKAVDQTIEIYKKLL